MTAKQRLSMRTSTPQNIRCRGQTMGNESMLSFVTVHSQMPVRVTCSRSSLKAFALLWHFLFKIGILSYIVEMLPSNGCYIMFRLSQKETGYFSIKHFNYFDVDSASTPHFQFSALDEIRTHIPGLNPIPLPSHTVGS